MMMQTVLFNRAFRISAQFPYHIRRLILPLLDVLPPDVRGDFALRLVRLVNDFRYSFGK